MNVSDTDICANCGREFAEHEYVPDSITDYICPVPHQESAYGFFHGGDPRTFHPDAEHCTKEELENHRRACELWNEAAAKGETPDPEECPSGWIVDDDGKRLVHVLKAPYGIGVYTVEMEQFWSPREHDYEEESE